MKRIELHKAECKCGGCKKTLMQVSKKKWMWVWMVKQRKTSTPMSIRSTVRRVPKG